MVLLISTQESAYLKLIVKEVFAVSALHYLLIYLWECPAMPETQGCLPFVAAIISIWHTQRS